LRQDDAESMRHFSCARDDEYGAGTAILFGLDAVIKANYFRGLGSFSSIGVGVILGAESECWKRRGIVRGMWQAKEGAAQLRDLGLACGLSR